MDLEQDCSQDEWMPEVTAILIGEFDVQCPECKKIHHRNFWSIAHLHVQQSLPCQCGYRLVIEPVDKPDDHD